MSEGEQCSECGAVSFPAPGLLPGRRPLTGRRHAAMPLQSAAK